MIYFNLMGRMWIFNFYGYWAFMSLIQVAQFQYTSQVPTTRKVCDTPECHKAAQILKKSIDPQQNPCDDFYQFSCGNWPKNHPNEISTVTNSTLQIRFDNNMEELIEFLKKNNTKKEPETVHKIRKLYALCTNTNTFYVNSSKVVDDVLRASGLPVKAPIFPNPPYDLAVIFAKLYKTIGSNTYFVLAPAPNPNNKSQNILTLTSIDFFSIGSLPIAGSQMRHFSRNVLELCSGMTLEDCSNKLFEDSRRIKLMGATSSQDNETTAESSETENEERKILSLVELQNLTNTIANEIKTGHILNWTQYIFTLYEDIEDINLELSKPEAIKIAVPPLKKLVQIIKSFQYSLAHKYVLLLWSKIINILGPYADYNFGKWQKNIFTRNEHKSREKVCLGILDNLVPSALSYYYVTNPHHEETNNEILEMITNIKKALKTLLEKASWMDEETTEKAVEKLKRLKSYVGYPKFVQNPERLDAYYKNLIVTDNYLESFVKIEQSKIRRTLQSLNKLNDQKEEDKVSLLISPATVNAYYLWSHNVFFIPAAILDSPLYEHSLRALTYGLMGSIIGHEITHGFDTVGSQYNASGHIENWWKPDTFEEYKKRAKCFQTTYANYSSNFHNITTKGNSSVTLPEDIADNGGFKISLSAYRDFIKQNGPEPLLPSFENYTLEQLFTLSFTQFYCEHPTSSSTSQYDDEVHSPSAVRVNGVVKNSAEFAEIWNCPKGSKMNPNNEKCVLF